MAMSKIYRRTNGAGVDIVVEPLEEEGYSIAFDFSECLAPYGRLVDISLSKFSNSVHNRVRFGNKKAMNISRASINMIDFLERSPALAHATFQRATKLAFKLGMKPPQPLHTFRAGEFENVFRHFNVPGMIGKRVVEMNPDMSILANMKSRPRYSFRSDATYVIASGLGGLGRSFARWMVNQGARNLILLSRSGAREASAKKLIAELVSKGVSVATPSIDICDNTNLKIKG